MTMSKEANLAKVRALYAAFGKGDIATVLQGLHPDAVWNNPGPPEFAYFGTHRGRDAIAQNVFGFIGANLDIARMEPTEILANDDTVVVLLDMEASVRATGKRYEQKTAHVWTFVDGAVTAFHDFQDNHAVVTALRP
jgi:ketosteroid isomerase-like protein